MELHTHIDKYINDGELYGLSGVYNKMSNDIYIKKAKSEFVESVLKYVDESDVFEKLTSAYSKNEKLFKFIRLNLINEAIKHTLERYEVIAEDHQFIRDTKLRIKHHIQESLSGIKKNYYVPRLYKVDNTIRYNPQKTSNFDNYSIVDNDYLFDILEAVSKKRSIINKDDKKDKKDSKDEVSTVNEHPMRHNYSIESIVIECIAGNNNKTQLVPPTYVYNSGDIHDKSYMDSSIKNVLDGINATCEIHFEEKDFIWLANGRPTPHLKCSMAIDAQTAQSNPILNSMFGVQGTYKDFLFKADGTMREPMPKNKELTDTEIDVNILTTYPIMQVYVTLLSWDVVNGKDVMRTIGKEDFEDTKVTYVD